VLAKFPDATFSNSLLQYYYEFSPANLLIPWLILSPPLSIFLFIELFFSLRLKCFLLLPDDGRPRHNQNMYIAIFLPSTILQILFHSTFSVFEKIFHLVLTCFMSLLPVILYPKIILREPPSPPDFRDLENFWEILWFWYPRPKLEFPPPPRF